MNEKGAMAAVVRDPLADTREEARRSPRRRSPRQRTASRQTTASLPVPKDGQAPSHRKRTPSAVTTANDSAAQAKRPKRDKKEAAVDRFREAGYRILASFADELDTVVDERGDRVFDDVDTDELWTIVLRATDEQSLREAVGFMMSEARKCGYALYADMAENVRQCTGIEL